MIGQQKLKIKYANCWEDPWVLIKALKPKEGSRILSIASAGDNSLSLLSTGPSLLVAADLNQSQLFLTELKLNAIVHLERSETLAFLGFHPSKNRWESYLKIREYIGEPARTFFNQRPEDIQKGIIYTGKFEKYFLSFFRWILPLIHSQSNVDLLFRAKSEEEQQRFYEEKWNSWRWKALFNLFFSKRIMGRAGRDPSYMQYVDGDVAERTYSKAASELRTVKAQSNMFLRFNLKGSFTNLIPHYLQEENYLKIRSNAKSLKYYHGPIEQAAEAFGSFDAMNLSDLFEYLDDELFQSLGKRLVDQLNSSGRMAYWNLMVPRFLSKKFHTLLCDLNEEARVLKSEDIGFYYDRFILEERR